MNAFAYGIPRFFTDWHQSDARLYLLIQWVLITFLLTLTLVSDSIQTHLQQNLKNLLGSDVVVTRYQPLNADQLAQLKDYSDTLSSTQVQTITLANKGQYQAAQLKLVDDHYPVQGTLSTGVSVDGAHVSSPRGPGIGEIWLDSRLHTALGIRMGDSLNLGDTNLRLTRIIFHEPDRLMEGHTVAMRAMAHMDSFASTNDSILHRYLLTTSNELKIQEWLKEAAPDAKLISKENSRHPLSSFWKRVENFIGLAAVILFFMAAIAIDLVGRRQIKQERYRQAIYLSVGQPLSSGIKIALAKFLIGFMLACIPAIVSALLLQILFLQQLQAMFVGLSAQVATVSVFGTLALAFGLLFSFQMPFFWQLKSASVASLIKEQTPSRFLVKRIFWSVASLSLLAAWYSDNPLLTGIMLLVLLVTLAIILVLTYLIITSSRWVCKRSPGLFSFSLFMMNQRLLSKSTQVVGIGLCLTLLLFTLMLLRDIGDAMERNTRVNDGNLIISKASQEQVASIQAWSNKYASPIRQLRAYTRAQLIQINDNAIAAHINHPSESMATLQKPIRLSWSSKLPTNNRIVQGEFWRPGEANWQQISVEDEIMTDMRLAIGDTLTFYILDQSVDFEIVSSHAYQAGEGSVTFWFQVPDSARKFIGGKPFYMGSMEVAQAGWPHLTELWQQHPTLGLAPLKELTQNYDNMLLMVTKMVTALSGLLLVMALIVIAASVKGFEESERKKNGLLLSLGLQKRHCSILTSYEWMMTSVISALAAIAGTWLAGVLIYQSQFSLTYTPNFFWLFTTVVIVSVLITGAGMLFNRRSLNVSVMDLMKE